MDFLLEWLVRGIIGFIRLLPIDLAARFGRGLGAIAWVLDRRHRRVAVENLTSAFGNEWSADKVESVAREHFRRLGENYVCAIRLAGVPSDQLADRVEYVGYETHLPPGDEGAIFAAGHFGNFELYARFAERSGGRTCATTYRALRQPGLNRVMQSLRELSSMNYLERRKDASRLQQLLAGRKVVLGLLADQHAGDKGHWLPLLGKNCSCSPAPAVYALRYRLPLAMIICYRTGLARWRMEAGPTIRTMEPDGSLRSSEAVTADIQREYEQAIRRDPANWFWVHRRWKPASAWQQKNAGAS